MSKKIGIIALVILGIIIFVAPIRKGVTNLFSKNKGEIIETQIIGSVSGYNGRVKEIQKILKDLGFDPGSVDGRMGSQTRKMIMEFQKSKKLIPTGMIDSATREELNKQREEIAKGALNPSVEHEPILEAQDFIDTENKDDRPTAEKISQKSQVRDEIMSHGLKSKDRTRQAQIALKKAGFYTGDIDGKSGPQTKKAVKAFQKSKGLNPDGVIGVRTWGEISKILKK